MSVAYRDEQQALLLEVKSLKQENERLREALEHEHERYRELVDEQHEQRRKNVRMVCVQCRGNLLAVAIVAGHDIRNPLPLKMSTLRFGSPDGGFTASAPVRSYACSSCGYIHNFIDMGHED